MIRIWIHIVIYSKYSFASVHHREIQNIKELIVKGALDSDIIILSLNGSNNHLHFLLNFDCHQTLADVVSSLKNISKRYIKRHIPQEVLFEWELDYFAFSISSSLLDLERYCIDTQESYHTFKDLSTELAMHINECQIDYQNL